MKEKHITGIHLDVDKRETLEDSGDAFLVGAGLISRQYVVDSSQQMRTLDDLKAAVFASGWIVGLWLTRHPLFLEVRRVARMAANFGFAWVGNMPGRAGGGS